MQKYRAIALAIVFFVLALGVRVAYSQGTESSTVQVHVVITDQTFNDGNEVPVLRPDGPGYWRSHFELKIPSAN